MIGATLFCSDRLHRNTYHCRTEPPADALETDDHQLVDAVINANEGSLANAEPLALRQWFLVAIRETVLH